MTDKNKTIPKSLDTVRVITTMARYILQHGPCAAHKSRAEAVEDALALLGYAGSPDTYALAAAAAKALLAR
jgi:hypothetical protein